VVLEGDHDAAAQAPNLLPVCGDEMGGEAVAGLCAAKYDGRCASSKRMRP
jgi:hypothetical protein